MKEMIAFCGIACHECPTFLAMQTNDDRKRFAVARLWSRHFSMNLKIEDINCDGCKSGSHVLFRHCQTCEIRTCAMDRSFKNCAFCDEYRCEKLDNFLKLVPNAKKRLDRIRFSL